MRQEQQPTRCDAIDLDGNTTRINLKGCGLTSVPAHIDWCALKSLKLVDMSQNLLESIPLKLACASTIRIFFISDNPRLTQVPVVVRQLPGLEIYAQRSSGLRHIAAADFPFSLAWLILTGNLITSLPDLASLPIRKLMVSHNRLASVGTLPSGLEMLSIANNQLRSLPESVRTSRASWVVLSSNPLLEEGVLRLSVPELTLDDYPRLRTLATNQEKHVILSSVSGRPVAIKFFGAMDSSGLPQHEVQMCGMIGDGHRRIINTLGVQLNRARRPAVALEYLDAQAGWAPMGDRPTFDSVTRGTFGPQHSRFSPAEILHVGMLIGEALAELHSLGVVHGDVYAHNVMARAQRSLTTRAEIKLGDFGTAMRITPALGPRMRAWDMRAFALLLDDLLLHSRNTSHHNPQLRRELVELKDAMLSEEDLEGDRASMEWVMRRLNSLATGWTAARGLWRDAAGSKRNLTFDGLMVYVTGRNISAGREWRAPGFARDATATFRFDFSTNGGSARWAANYSNLEDVLCWQDGSRWTRISQ
jgi:hypothetical protein